MNRPLLREFVAVLARERWDVALLQEAPPRWLEPLCRGTGAGGASALTSRNLGAAVRAFVAERNPDLIASNEGGSNQLLVRPPWRLVEARRLTLTRRPERRRLLWARLAPTATADPAAELTVANMHLTADDTAAAAREALVAAEHAGRWSAGRPLIFGGDLNLRPARSGRAFDQLRERYGLDGATPGRAIDHLLSVGLEPLEPPQVLPPERRELPADGGSLAIRLSDHAPVTRRFALPRDRS